MDPGRGRIGPDGLAALLRRAGLAVAGVRLAPGAVAVDVAGPGGRTLALRADRPDGAPALYATRSFAYRCDPSDLSPDERATAMLAVAILARLEDRLVPAPIPAPVAARDLDPQRIAPLAAHGAPVEAVLDGADLEAPARLADLDARARDAGLALSWVLPATAGALGRPDRLPAVIDALRVRDRPDRVLAIAWPDPADDPQALPLTAAGALPDAVVRLLGDRIPVRSRAGRPLCLFPRAAEHVLLHGASWPAPPDAVFGPACGGCALRAACGGVSRGHAARFSTDDLAPFGLPPGVDAAPEAPARAPWDSRLWWLLADRPAAAVALREVLPPDALPDVPCVLPWTRLEIHEGGTHGPCCADYLQAPGRAPTDTPLDALWHGPPMRAVRQAMADGRPTRTCRPTCPVLVGGTDLPGDLVLRGGPAATVAVAIARVRDLLAMRAVPEAPPAALCFAATSFCNYDCVMCDCGRRGTLDDQPDDAFFARAAGWAARGVELEVNGGEPLASPRFLAFLDRLAGDGVRPAPVGLVTNGSLLTPDRIDRWAPILRGVVVSLNAADAPTYRAINRGAPWAVVRAHLDHLLRTRREGRFTGGLSYSMVVLRANLEQVPAFVELALRDDVDARFLLPQGDRDGQSVMTAPGPATRAADLLEAAAARLDDAGRVRPARAAAALARVLRDRVARNVFDPL